MSPCFHHQEHRQGWRAGQLSQEDRRRQGGLADGRGPETEDQEGGGRQTAGAGNGCSGELQNPKSPTKILNYGPQNAAQQEQIITRILELFFSGELAQAVVVTVRLKPLRLPWPKVLLSPVLPNIAPSVQPQSNPDVGSVI